MTMGVLDVPTTTFVCVVGFGQFAAIVNVIASHLWVATYLVASQVCILDANKQSFYALR